MSETPALKPCPLFCGRNKSKIEELGRSQNDKNTVRVVCQCGASSGWYDTADEASAAWNKRSVGSSAPISAGSIAPESPPPPVSEEVVEEVATAMHDAYEAESARTGWKTQEQCRVSYENLPPANRLAMLASARAAITSYQAALKGGGRDGG